MPDLEANRDVWSSGWDWSTAGDEWSEWWGGTQALWHGALLPRIHAFVPTGTVLEIAPGFGRWSQYLKTLADRLVLVDMTEQCVENCRRRFAADPHVEAHQNDGRSLAMVEDGAVDFAFSFDSLVHAERDVLHDYLGELARTLAPDGIAFLHHSNIGRHRRAVSIARRVPGRHVGRLMRAGAVVNVKAWRAEERDGPELRRRL